MANSTSDGSMPLAAGIDTRTRGFDAEQVMRAIHALRQRPGVAPTLVFVNTSGEMLTEPLVGGDHQFFSVYLDRAFEEAGTRLHDKRVRPR